MLRVGLLVLLLAGVIHGLEGDCGACDLSGCEEPVGCLAGTAPDQCECCSVCARTLYQVCVRPGQPQVNDVYMPDCGRGLECRERDDLQDDDHPESLCFCSTLDAVCGSDGVTYENACALNEASEADTGANIHKVRDLPCDSPPVIVSPPEHVKNKTNSDVAFVCEALGFPIPTIEWTWKRVDGKTLFMPSDDLRMSVNMRGGPERHEITGWLQIMDVQKEHEGDYTCVAQNEHGMDKAVARLNVKHHDKSEKPEKNP